MGTAAEMTGQVQNREQKESDSRNGSEKWVWAEGLSSLEQIH